MGTEIERKFLIRLPDFDTIPDLRIQEITQTYLTPLPSDPEPERRVRKIAENGRIRWIYTEKRPIRGMGKIARQEEEWEISEAEYGEKLADAMTRLTKTRYSFPFAGHTVEIDVYPHEIGGDALEGLAVMEIELESPDEAIEFPPFIRVIRELTGTREFSNKALARPVK